MAYFLKKCCLLFVRARMTAKTGLEITLTDKIYSKLTENMKKGILIMLLSAFVGGLTAYAVVKSATSPEEFRSAVSDNPAVYRTVRLNHDSWPDFTYAAENAVDAVVYV